MNYAVSYFNCQTCKEKVNCGNCEEKIVSRLKANPQIQDVSLSIVKKTLTIQTSLDEDKLEDAIDALGLFFI